MVSNKLNASSASETKPKASKMARTRKTTADRHLKVNGRDRRIRLPASCAERVSELTKKLGNRTSGQTIEWLLVQAETSINNILGNNGTTSSAPVETIPVSLSPRPKLVSPLSVVPPPGFEAKPVPVLAGDEESKPDLKPKLMLPAFMYGPEIDLEFSAEEMAKFLFPSTL